MSGCQIQNMMLDKKKFGEGLRFLRRSKGIKNADEYASAIYVRTGRKIHPNTLKKIEAGRQSITTDLLVAISLTLYDEVFSDEIRDITKMSVDGNETIGTV